MPYLPNFHLPKQNWADRGTEQSKANEAWPPTTMVTLYIQGDEEGACACYVRLERDEEGRVESTVCSAALFRVVESQTLEKPTFLPLFSLDSRVARSPVRDGKCLPRSWHC